MRKLKINVSTSIFLSAIPLIAGCSSELAKKYTLENILIGAAIGVGITIFITVALRVFGKGDDQTEESSALGKEDNRTEESGALENSGTLNDADRAEINSFLQNSYLKWQTGTLDNLGDYYREQTENADLEEIANNLLDTKGYQELLEFCFNLRTPEIDEFIIGIHPPGFMVTSKFLYIYENKQFAKMHVIDLCDIRAFEYKTTTFTTSCKLTLRNEGELLIKLSEYPDDEVIRKLQEMNGCEYLLEETPSLAS